MYKSYETADYLKVADECTERIRRLLTSRHGEIMEFNDAINDRYPFEDLALRWAEVDYESELIRHLLSHLELCSAELKEKIRTKGC